MDRLSDYILAQVKRGYEIRAIENYLLRKGYPPDIVRNAVKNARSALENPLKHYISDMISRGYTRQQVISYLLAHGYTLERINEALAKDSPKGHPYVLSALVFILIAVVFSGISMCSHDDPEALLAYDLKVIDKSIASGSVLRFTDRFVNEGGKRDYDVQVEYFIQDFRTLSIVDRWEESFKIDTLENHNNQVRIDPSIPEGKYIILGVVKYFGNENRAYDTFTINASAVEPTCHDGILNQGEENTDCGGPCENCTFDEFPTCYDSIKNQGEQGIDCGGPCKKKCPSCSDGIKNQGEEDVDCGGPCMPCEMSCSDGILNQGEQGIDCGGPCDACKVVVIKLSDIEIRSQVRDLKPGQMDEGIRLCNSIENMRNADYCFFELAKAVNDTDVCSHIDADKMSDLCYMYFVQNDDFTVCDNITDIFLKQSCQNLRERKKIEEPSAPDMDEWNRIANKTLGLSDQDEIIDFITS